MKTFEVTQPTVDQLGAGRRGVGGEIVLLAEQYAEAAAGGVTRDTGSLDTAADNEDIEVLKAQMRRLGPRSRSPRLTPSVVVGIVVRQSFETPMDPEVLLRHGAHVLLDEAVEALGIGNRGAARESSPAPAGSPRDNRACRAVARRSREEPPRPSCPREREVAVFVAAGMPKSRTISAPFLR